ncbi:MAG: hypothetical protein ACLT8E_00935 [Akkermansia sp.]
MKRTACGGKPVLYGRKGAPVFMAVLPPEGRKMKQFIDGMTAEEWNGILSSLSARDAAEETRKPGGSLEQYSRYHLRSPRSPSLPPRFP